MNLDYSEPVVRTIVDISEKRERRSLVRKIGKLARIPIPGEARDLDGHGFAIVFGRWQIKYKVAEDLVWIGEIDLVDWA